MAEDYIESSLVFHGKFTSIKAKEIDYMIKRENFLSIPSNKKVYEALKDVFKNSTQAEVDDVLSEKNLDQDKYQKSHSMLCKKCADKDICLEMFRNIKK